MREREEMSFAEIAQVLGTEGYNRLRFGIGNETAINLLVLCIPSAQLASQIVELLVPYGFWIEHQTIAEYILSEYEISLARCVEHLAENDRQKDSSLAVGFGFYVT